MRGSYKSNTKNRETKRVNGSIFCVQKFKDETGREENVCKYVSQSTDIRAFRILF